jgi:hypothetical protein
MSATLQALVLGPSLTGCGALPSLTIRHQVARQTGKTARICGNRTKPSAGKAAGDFGFSLTLGILLPLLKDPAITVQFHAVPLICLGQAQFNL